MKRAQVRAWNILLLILLFLLARPPGVQSQCVVTNVVTFMSLALPPTYPYDFTRVTKYLNPAANCPDPTVNQRNAFGCGEIPNNTMATKLVASAYTNTVNPFCMWICDCGQVTIDGNDNLPIELMDFKINEPVNESGDSTTQKPKR